MHANGSQAIIGGFDRSPGLGLLAGKHGLFLACHSSSLLDISNLLGTCIQQLTMEYILLGQLLCLKQPAVGWVEDLRANMRVLVRCNRQAIVDVRNERFHSPNIMDVPWSKAVGLRDLESLHAIGTRAWLISR